MAKKSKSLPPGHHPHQGHARPSRAGCGASDAGTPLVRGCGDVAEHYDVGARLGEKVAKDMIAPGAQV
jgi:hypothetical protein